MNAHPHTLLAPPRAPRLRLALAVIASTIISLLADPRWLVVILAGGAALMSIALWQSSERLHLLRRMLVVNLFVAMLWLTLPWSLSLDGITASAAGRELAGLISLRTNAIALWCIGLLAGMDAFAIGRAAAGLGLPHKMARLLTLMVRYFSLLDDSRRRIDRAMRARGFQARCDRRSVQVLAQQVALLLVHAMLRAERIGIAMRARGFAPHVAPRPQTEGRIAGRPRPAMGQAATLVFAVLLASTSIVGAGWLLIT